MVEDDRWPIVINCDIYITLFHDGEPPRQDRRTVQQRYARPPWTLVYHGQSWSIIIHHWDEPLRQATHRVQSTTSSQDIAGQYGFVNKQLSQWEHQEDYNADRDPTILISCVISQVFPQSTGFVYFVSPKLARVVSNKNSCGPFSMRYTPSMKLAEMFCSLPLYLCNVFIYAHLITPVNYCSAHLPKLLILPPLFIVCQCLFVSDCVTFLPELSQSSCDLQRDLCRSRCLTW